MSGRNGVVTKEKLIELYVNDPRASMKSVANKLGASRSTVAKAMKRFGLQSKPPGEIPGVEIPELSDQNWLANQLETKTFRQLARELGTSVGRIADRAYRHGIVSPSTKKSKAIKEAMTKRYPNGRVGAEASNWKGGRRAANGAGYIYAYTPDHPKATRSGYVMEHRLIAEKTIGRYLEEDEVIHHINGDKTDNRPENLAVMTNAQHISEHFKASHEVAALRTKVINLEERLKTQERYIETLERKLSEYQIISK